MTINTLQQAVQWFDWFLSGERGSTPPFSAAFIHEELDKELRRANGEFVGEADLEELPPEVDSDLEYKDSVRELRKWLNEGRCELYPVDRQALALVLSRAQQEIDNRGSHV